MATSTPIPNAAFAGIAQAGPGSFSTNTGGALPSGAIYTNAGRIAANDPGLANLSLANGMTAGYGDLDGHTTNPPAFPGTYGGNPNWAPNRVGFIRNLPGSLPADINGSTPTYALYFIYNPNEVDVGFAMNNNQQPPLYLYGGTGGTGGSLNLTSGTSSLNAPNLVNSQTVAWSLLFDRTYDMLYDTNPGENRGVLRDVAALYNLMGTFDSGVGATPISTPCQVVFGQTSSGQLWGFTGYISSVAITYGIFRANMIPSRCEVDLTMTATYVSSQIPSTAAPATTPAPTNNIIVGKPNINQGISGYYASPPAAGPPPTNVPGTSAPAVGHK